MTADSRGDTIFALSSGSLPSGIAVVRVSGPRAGEVLTQLAGRLPEPRRAAVRALRYDKGDLLDRALTLWFPGPTTATGEDLAELHLHGGRAVVAAVLAAIGAQDGCRAAEPGEFTRRAFLNERIDLAEAEGLADLLAAETEAARRQALRAAEGGLSASVEQLRTRLLALSARAEAQLQFGDDEGDVGEDMGLSNDIAALRLELEDLLSLPPAERLRDGFRIVIAGPPNIGKSSLINALSGRQAAIASPEAGTTRDLIEVPLLLDGIATILIDSAGLRETDQTIERIGIDRAHDAIASADLVLWLGEPNDCPVPNAIRLHPKCDLAPASCDSNLIAISALTGEGLGELRSRISETLTQLAPPIDAILLNQRQRILIGDCAAELDASAAVWLPELVGEHLRLALRALDRIVGRSDTEAVLDSIFGQFCIGK